MPSNDRERTSELVASVLQDIRNKRSCNQMFDITAMKAKTHSFVNDLVLSRKRKGANYNILQNLEGRRSNGESYRPEIVQEL